MIYQSYDINMIPGGVPVIVQLSQYDAGTRTLQFTLYKGSELFTDSGTVTLRGKKPDGNVFEYECTYSNGVASIVVNEQMTPVAGKTLCELRVTNNGQVVGSANFIMMVEKAPYTDEDVQSDSYLPVIEKAKSLRTISGEYPDQSSSAAISTGTWQSVATVTLPAGKWLVNLAGSFSSTGSGARGLTFSEDGYYTTPGRCTICGYAPSLKTVLNVTRVVEIEEETTFRIGMYAGGSSGPSVNVAWNIYEML